MTTEVNSLGTTVGNFSTEIQDIGDEVDAVAADVATLTTSVGTNTTAIAGNTTAIATNNTKLTNLSLVGAYTHNAHTFVINAEAGEDAIVVNDDSTLATGGNITVRRSRGTPAARGALNNADVVLRLRGFGYTTNSSMEQAGRIEMVSTGAWDATNCPADIVMLSTTGIAGNSLVERLRCTTTGVNITGKLGITGDIVKGAAAITLPSITSTLATLAGTETLSSKTLTTPIISSIVNTGTLTLPTSTDTLVGRNTTDTLANKTLTAPVISTISNSGTITLPTGTRTLVARDTTDTLTNKTTGATAFTGAITSNSDISSSLHSLNITGAKALNISATTINTTTKLAIGTDAATNQSDANNVAIGVNALKGGSTGATATSTVAIGQNAGQSLQTANSNVIIGSSAGSVATGLTTCVLIGSNAGQNNTGAQNTLIGYDAGHLSVTTGFANTMIGGATVMSGGQWNGSTCIGAGSVISADAEVVLGNAFNNVIRCGNDGSTSLGTATNDLPLYMRQLVLLTLQMQN